MKQYNEIKERHQDAILLFRLGDFYEMFGEDAKVASKALQIALTSRDKNKEHPMPMCGIPFFASEGYIAKLIRAGFKVAVCEQVSDPKDSKGIVKREVVRIITPGTHTPESPKENNYTLAFYPVGEGHGIAAADISTGEFLLYETTRPLQDELSRLGPSEVVVMESLHDDIHYSTVLEGYHISPISDWKFDYSDAYRLLLEKFRVSSLEGFGVEGMRAAISASGALMGYLTETQLGELGFRKLTPLNQSDYMFLDTQTQRNLELLRTLKDSGHEGTLLWALDETLTPMGGRMMRSAIIRPLVSAGLINFRQAAVRHIVEDYELSDTLRKGFRNIQDIERLAQRIASGSANARDMVALKLSISHLPDIGIALQQSQNPYLQNLRQGISDFSALSALIERAIVDHPPVPLKEGGIIRQGFDSELDELRSISVTAKDVIARIESDERKATGINSLKVGFNRVFGYYIEITKANLAQVPEHFIRKQTLVGGERFITPELKEYEEKVLGAEDRIKTIEYRLFTEILLKCKGAVSSLLDSAEAIAHADFLVSMAVTAKRYNYVAPTVDDSEGIEIVNGRHPVLERLNLTERFIPNDTMLDMDAARVLVITGPNMAGKSTYMRQVALVVLMAQMGGYVPAESARIGITDRIFTRIGASDFLTKGQSTFMVEMIETANILNNATRRSVVILDEVGRGTSTFDGISIAWATAEHIATGIGARTLFATHYNELTELAHTVEGVKNFNISVREWGEEIIFLRKIEPGPADKSYGIQVARLAGLPQDVLAAARRVLERLEKRHRGEYASRNVRQMDLFSEDTDPLTDELQRLDTSKITPDEAVKLLVKLKKLAKKK